MCLTFLRSIPKHREIELKKSLVFVDIWIKYNICKAPGTMSDIVDVQ